MYDRRRLGGVRGNHDRVLHRAVLAQLCTTWATVDAFCPMAQ
jgi:hypothetical protein